MTQINAYLNFNGNCREAMTFYQQCLGGELSLQAIGDSPIAESFPPEMRTTILHASLEKDTLLLLGTDMVESDQLVEGNTVSLSLTCSSEDEIKKFFDRLAAGGKITHPLHRFFAGLLGTLTDKFGKNWLLYYDKK